MNSIEEIYKDHASMVYKYLVSLSGDTEVAEELTQETFCQAIRCINKFNNESCKVSTWLCAIAKNQYLAYCKKNSKHREVKEKNDLTSGSAESEVISNCNHIELLKYLHQIKEPIREVMYLRLYGNLSYKEIGEIMGQSENWARVNFFRGKKIIAKEVNRNE